MGVKKLEACDNWQSNGLENRCSEMDWGFESLCFRNAFLAQLVEHEICNFGVVGSRPIEGSKILSYGVMVARQVLVLLVCVQIAEGQHDLSSEGAHLTTT